MSGSILSRRIAWALLLLPLVACGGGGGGGSGDGGGGEPVVLFADDFSGGGVLPNWVPNPMAAASIDWGHGDPTAPCLSLDGGSARLDEAFAAAGGLDFYVRVMFPDDTHCTPLTPGQEMPMCCSDIVRIYSSLGSYVAGVEMFRAFCENGTMIRYWIKNQAQNGVEEALPHGYFTGQFNDISFHLQPDGSAEWRRDGVVKQSLPASSPWGTLRTDVSYTLDLVGGWVNFGVGDVPTGFDDVLVQR